MARINGKKLLITTLSAIFGLGTTFSPSAAIAWDTSTTHQQITNAAILHAQMHRNLMDGTQQRFGIFSQLQVRPNMLDSDLRRELENAILATHADSGSRPLGGPGSCPGALAPLDTQRYCVDGETWRQSALGWLKLGLTAELSAPERVFHHFSSATEDTKHWSDQSVPETRTRWIFARRNLSSFAGAWLGTNPTRGGESSASWLDTSSDMWSTASLREHLRASQTQPNTSNREAALALALVDTGAILHVLQDATVPAFARADARAFFGQISDTSGDRGLVLQEWARQQRGQHWVESQPLASNWSLPADTISNLGTLLHDERTGHGVAQQVRAHMLSDGRLAPPSFIDPELDAHAAAIELLGNNHGLSGEEIESAKLSNWPAASGYLLSSAGRPLAAFKREENGKTGLFLDSTIYGDQTAQLLPLAVALSQRALDRVFPSWPNEGVDSIHVPVHWGPCELITLEEAEFGERKILSSVELAAGAIHSMPAASAPKGGTIVRVLLSNDSKYVPFLAIQTASEGGSQESKTRGQPNATPAILPGTTQTSPAPLTTTVDDAPKAEVEADSTSPLAPKPSDG